MSTTSSVSLCPICKSKHFIPSNDQPDRSSANPIKSAGNSTDKEPEPNIQASGTCKRYQPATRCPLPDHVSDFKALVVDHNIINRKIMQRTLEKLGMSSDQAKAPEDGLRMYQDDPMKYAVVCVDPAMFHQPVRGLDLMRLIRNFESLNNIPRCFLICTDGSRAVSIGRSVTTEMVVDCGVDLILPWYRYMLPLYDALARTQKRPEWRDRPEVLTKVDVQITATQPIKASISEI